MLSCHNPGNRWKTCQQLIKTGEKGLTVFSQKSFLLIYSEIIWNQGEKFSLHKFIITNIVRFEKGKMKNFKIA